MSGRLNGLDLFSGIGGITVALAPWVRPVAYCENDRYAAACLLSRMRDGSLPCAPIWDDVRTLRGEMLPSVDIIYGGFPCQDISAAGRGKGLAGERSGLFFEIMRLVDEIRPPFLFLENVPAITTRGLGAVAAEITKRGYDCRWTTLSAAEVGAPHLRKRWWLLAYADSERRGEKEQQSDMERNAGELAQFRDGEGAANGALEDVADAMRGRLSVAEPQERSRWHSSGQRTCSSGGGWWSTEPDVGRVANGVLSRVDRLRGLGNAVVPQCAREAFKRLMGL